MRITISGKPGAGKTTTAKQLASDLNYDFISVGNLQGQIAIEKGITINELMKLGKKDSSIHLEIDEKTIELGKVKDNFVIEGWIAFHFIPNSFKIFLDVDEEVGAKRIFYDKREDEPKQKDIKKTIKKIKERLKNTSLSFQKYYDVDFLNTSNYDLVLDTSNLSPEEVIAQIKNSFKGRKQ